MTSQGWRPRLAGAVLASATLAAAVLAGPALAIVGPSIEEGGLSATVLMVLNRSGAVAGFCSGIVVRQDAVLTAAHCVPQGAVIKVHYRDGETIALLDVAATARSPGFRPDAIRKRQRSIDLALIRLAKPLPPAFRPAVLGETRATTPGTAYRLAGFGVGREGAADTSGTLRTAQAIAQTPLSDVLLWSRDPQERGGGACTGDSGGPVIAADDTVVAVIAWSAGVGGARCGAMSQAVWIGPQRGWIDAVLRDWPTARP